MMARYAGGRPGSSRRVRLVPVRRSGMDHRAMARIVLAMARQMAAEADEAAEPEVDEAVSTGVGACAKREPGTSDGSAAASDAATPWAGAHSGQSARGVASVERCAANEPFSASAGSGLAGRCSRQRHDGAHLSTHESATADCSRFSSSDEAAAASSALGGAP